MSRRGLEESYCYSFWMYVDDVVEGVVEVFFMTLHALDSGKDSRRC